MEFSDPPHASSLVSEKPTANHYFVLYKLWAALGIFVHITREPSTVHSHDILIMQREDNLQFVS